MGRSRGGAGERFRNRCGVISSLKSVSAFEYSVTKHTSHCTTQFNEATLSRRARQSRSLGQLSCSQFCGFGVLQSHAINASLPSCNLFSLQEQALEFVQGRDLSHTVSISNAKTISLCEASCVLTPAHDLPRYRHLAEHRSASRMSKTTSWESLRMTLCTDFKFMDDARAATKQVRCCDSTSHSNVRRRVENHAMMHEKQQTLGLEHDGRFPLLTFTQSDLLKLTIVG